MSVAAVSAGALQGVTVVEFGSMLMVPYACQTLGDLGADVVKVEGRTGDVGRTLGGTGNADLSGVAMNLHRNKRAIRLDIERPSGRRAFLDLLREADVFVTNLRPRALRKLGISYEDLHPVNAGLVYCEAHGFSSRGTEADRPTVDDVIQSETGAAALSSGEPTLLPMLIADKQVGLSVALAVTAALVARQTTGRGQRIEVPMFDTFLAFTLVEHLNGGALSGGEPGYSRIRQGDHGPYRTADGYLAVMPIYERHWEALRRACGASGEGSGQLPLAALLCTRTTHTWIEICTAEDIPYGEVVTIEDLVQSDGPHRGVLDHAVHPRLGPYWQIAFPLQFSSTPAAVRRHAPLAGEHTAEVLAELGWSSQDARAVIDELEVT